MPRKDMTGQRFGRLVAQGPDISSKGYARWFCKCDCGQELTVRGDRLRFGNTRSCGCLALDLLMSMATTHGESLSAEFSVWKNMKQRCLNPHRDTFKNYGGRGITVCDPWLGSFEAFIADMGRRPSAKHTLKRIDNDAGYSRANCRWVRKGRCERREAA